MITLYFPSEKDFWFYVLTWGPILFILFIYLYGGEPIGFQLISYRDPLGYVITALLLLFLLWVWFDTGYKIENGHIKIYSGPFRKKIKISKITKVNTTKSLSSAPSWTRNKLEILYGHYDFINLSPRNKREFIQALQKENPQIKMDQKLQRLYG
ncbi:PH domain-containing protein [Halobacillus karajensis]|uniref:Uncharacterized protein YyaB-like PH domain-containing protein n=1 Tax=Halobacillus karajensis TaxID=195088 RepID=A0A024P880_9BACI|nr:hypothetical protein BN982_02604 [Halobacillus karajensis]CDQ25058.1 hypothetical protein BN983_03363 [Halobacillus karajensis]CDQ28581.1 hypothetical protein BN981_02889 [Halobacillus karajensis]